MYDLLVKHVNVADGSGEPMYKACVLVKDGKIAKIAPEIDEEAKLVLEANPDQVLCPGFFDVHTHNDLLMLADKNVTPQILQGVTYDISGNCGQSIYPVSKNPELREVLRKYTGSIMPIDRVPVWNDICTFEDYIKEVEKVGPRIHHGHWLGQGTIRIAVMGMDDRRATPEELEEMKALVREGMEHGALGLSTGLIYAPGVFTPEDEIIELAKVVGEYGGVYATHMRNESAKVVESVEEAIRIAKASGCKLLVSHHKVVGAANKGKQKKTLELMDKARAEGMTVMADQYLFNYGSTTLSALFPPKYLSKGIPALVEMLKDPKIRAEVKDNMENDGTWENFYKVMGPDGVLVVDSPKSPENNNLHLSELAEKMGKHPVDVAADLFVENDGVVVMAVRLSEQEVIEDIWKHPFTAGGSDGIGAGFVDLTHPRAYSATVHIFQEYVRERKVVSLEEAVRKCTSLPATFVGIKGKGYVKEGYDADLVLFNKETIGSKATFAKPRVKPEGVDYVFVMGEAVVVNGEIA